MSIQNFKYNDFFNEIEIIEIGLLYGCNLECPFCEINYHKLNKTPKEILQKKQLNFEDLRTFLRKFKKLRMIILCGTVSEPTLYYKFNELITEIDSLSGSPVIRLHTNGNYSKKLNLRKKDIVYFGIDGITQESYEKYRVKGNLQKVLENHKELKKIGCITILQLIEFEHNQEDEKNLKEFAELHNFDLIDIKKSDNPEDIFDKIYPNVKNQFKVSLRKHQMIFYKEIQIKASKVIKCSSEINNQIFINYKGGVYPCYGWFDTTHIPTITIHNSTDSKIINSVEERLNSKGESCERECNETSINYLRSKIRKLNETTNIPFDRNRLT